jgi:3-oxoacyl-[acyl-carrier protein] reductase
MSELEGRVAIVTGGGRGIGRDVALELARRRARVLVNDLFQDPAGVAAAESVAGEIRGAGGEAVANRESVAGFDSAAAITAAAVDAFGRVDILVNCAGNFGPANILTVEEQHWDSILAVHLTGHLATARAAVAQMLDQGGSGRIVMISSRGAFYSAVAAYSTAKAGVMGLSASLAAELKPHGITVNCILPSATTQLFPAGAASRLMGDLPPSLDMDPEAIPPIVAWLCGDGAAGVTGRYFYASGGDIAQLKQPFSLTSSDLLVRKLGRWTPDEVAERMSRLLGLGPEPG